MAAGEQLAVSCPCVDRFHRVRSVTDGRRLPSASGLWSQAARTLAASWPMAGRRHLAAGEPLATLGLPVAAVLLTASRWLLAARHWRLPVAAGRSSQSA